MDVERPYGEEDVARLRGSLRIAHTLARQGAEWLRERLASDEPVRALGASTGSQAVQQVNAGLEALYVSGWQVAGDANLAGQMYPDQSLYPSDSVPSVVRRINNALRRSDHIHHVEGNDEVDWFVPVVADAESGFGGALNCFELMRAMIEAGAAGVHFEDQLSSEKKCGHMGGKVLLPTAQAVRNLIAARLAADVEDVPTVLIARTDALGGDLLLSDADEADARFLTGERTEEGFYRTQAGMDQAIARGLAYAPYADLSSCETGTPDLEEAERFASAIHAEFPTGCSPTTARRRSTPSEPSRTRRSPASTSGSRSSATASSSSRSPASTPSTIRCSSWRTATAGRGCRPTPGCRRRSSRARSAATRRPSTGAGWFDDVAQLIVGGDVETTALAGSTEESQFG
jgi:isocitrate/methylisocitrate lyase